MATRHFDNASLGAFPESLLPVNLLMSGHAAPLRLVRSQAATPTSFRSAPLTSTEVEASNIGRCIRWVLAIEGGAALVIWAVLRLVL
jgi:hypothetical protein